MATDWLRKPWLYLVLTALLLAAAVGIVAVRLEASATSPIAVPTRQQVIGTWKSPSGAVLRLNPDGTFTARGLPASAGESSTLNIPPSGGGHWHVGPVPAEPPGVVFDFSRTVSMELLAERVGSAVVLYYDLGDPDEGSSGQYQFRKRQA
ncbi:MAG TPA: hypothetical protein VFQ44_24690 [Streptosporangiaceae bacterium]|nr:hypothetical protein [Streptosporangiaceae bacterium]